MAIVDLLLTDAERYEDERCLENCMSNLKVALFTGNYNHIRDGVSLTLNRWVEYLLNSGVEVLVFGPTIENPDLNHVGTLISVPSIKIPGRPEYRITIGFPSLEKNRLEEFKPDIIHIATPDILGFKALRWAKDHNLPLVSSYHTHFTSYLKYYKLHFAEPLGWKYLRWFYSHCKQIYVPTPSMVAELKAHDIGTGNDSLRIWARGVDTDLFNPDKRSLEWRKEKGFKDDEVVITFVSRLVLEKNLKIYANVVRKLENNNKNVRSLVVGDGPAKKDMMNMLPKSVFTGFLKGEELAVAYASSDIFFFPSDTETFGNVTLEGMASGLPCLVADAPGSKSLVDHGVNGYMAAVENEKAFYEYAKQLVENDQLREEMSKQSYIKSGDFTWEKINGGLLQNYYELVELQDIS